MIFDIMSALLTGMPFSASDESRIAKRCHYRYVSAFIRHSRPARLKGRSMLLSSTPVSRAPRREYRNS
jgi:hypothetical protein